MNAFFEKGKETHEMEFGTTYVPYMQYICKCILYAAKI